LRTSFELELTCQIDRLDILRKDETHNADHTDDTPHGKKAAHGKLGPFVELKAKHNGDRKSEDEDIA
jgi:hypothetical protein